MIKPISLAITVLSASFEHGFAQSEIDMGVVDSPSWDKTDHKNNEYLWTLQFGHDSHAFKIA